MMDTNLDHGIKLCLAFYFFNIFFLLHISVNSHTLNEILTPFGNCTSVLLIFNQSALYQFLNPFTDPIILLNHGEAFDPTQIPTRRTSFIRRRNPSKFCWAFIILQPETLSYIDYILRDDDKAIDTSLEFLRRLMYGAQFPPEYSSPQYFIWVTKEGPEFQRTFQKTSSYSVGGIGPREILVVNTPTSGDENNGFTLNYHNPYYADRTRAYLPMPWVEVPCGAEILPRHCFHQIEKVAETVSELNKHFWDLESWLGPQKTNHVMYYHHTDIFTQVYDQFFSTVKPVNLYQVAKITQEFDEFLGFLLLQDVLPFQNVSTKEPIRFYYDNYVLSTKQALQFQREEHNIILSEVKSYSFLSCHGVNLHKTLFLGVSPFDKYTWSCIFISGLIIFIIILCLTTTHHNPSVSSSWGLFSLIAIILENSIMSSIESKLNLTSNKFYYGLKIVLGSWIVMMAILSNWYKSSFTTEMIAPFQSTAPWRTMMDIQEFSIFFPVEDTPFNSKTYDNSPPSPLYHFHLGIESQLSTTMSYDGQSKTLQGYKQVATRLGYGLLYSVAHSFNENNNKSQSNRQRTPLKCLMYKYPHHFVNNLSSCHNVAYMDTAENVVSILPFINDNVSGKKFAKGEDGFLSSHHGWSTTTVRNNYVWKRLKMIITTGQYSHWESWFKRIKPKKLFQHYANWTHPLDPVAVQRLDFNSKIVTAFYLLGGFLGASLLILIGECCLRSTSRD